jgi:nucleoside 2-deoxyribosyltransferase
MATIRSQRAILLVEDGSQMPAPENAGEITQRKKVFVISPIGSRDSEVRKNADRFLTYIVRAALPAAEYEVIRADEDDSAWAITESMLRAILEADVCVADITGRNPNVMYELALAHAADKKVVIMKSDGGSLPFDIKDMRAIEYGMMPEEVEEAVRQLKAKVEHEPGSSALREMLNPVASAFRNWMDLRRVEAESGSPKDSFVRVVEEIERKVDKALRDSSRFGVPALVQSSSSQTILKSANGLLAEFGFLMDNLEANNTHSTTYKRHLAKGENLYRGVIEGQVGLDELEQWSDETRHILNFRAKTASRTENY